MRNTGIQVRLFNSHPHKEDDKENQAILFYNCFSTHILTRRMTVHDDTSLGVLQFFNSHPHKEDDPVGSMRYPLILFSTHILTRRMTVVVLDVGCR